MTLAIDLSKIDIAFYQQAVMSILLMISMGILIINFRMNWNQLKLKLLPNTGIIRFFTPSRSEQEIVVRFNDKVLRHKKGGKNLAHMIDPRRIFKKFDKPKNFEPLTDNQKYNEKLTIADLLKTQTNNPTFAGKTPVLNFRSDNAIPIDPYSEETTISGELLESMLIGAEATADIDFFKKLFGYKHIWQFAAAIAIGALASAFLSWQVLSAINTNPYFLGELPVCQIAAETAKVIVAGG